MTFVRPDRAPVLHARRAGSGPVLVLIHGVAGSAVIWDPLVPYLEADHTVVRFDLLGYGRSPRSDGRSPRSDGRSPRSDGRYTPDEHVEAIRATLAATGVSPPYTLVGLSMGANLALTYAGRWPDEVERLIGIGFPYFGTEADARTGLGHNPWTRFTVQWPRVAARAIPVTWATLRRSGLTRWHRGIYTPAMAEDALRVDYLAFEATVQRCMLHFPYDTSLAMSGELPRLFIHGSEDRWSPVDVVRRAVAPYPRTDFAVVEGGPHNLVVTRPAETARLVLAHLAGDAAGEEC